MKITISTTILIACANIGFAQGYFWPANPNAPTRIGAGDGPLAGTNIYAQFLAGSSPGSITPVGLVDFHIGGVVVGPNALVPSVPPSGIAYVQMLVWDSTLWGADFAAVPLEQFGRTDIVQVLLTSGSFPDTTYAPQFTEPAIVPVPEPSAMALGVAAAAVLALTSRARRTKPRGRSHPP